MLIRGVVQSAGGALLEGAVVSIVTAPVDVPDIAAVTGDDGTFAVAAPAPGRYRLGVRADGYAARELEFEITGDLDVQTTLIPDGSQPP
ncbi:carboxypeptidase-like regulatory domain-containing protein [Ilumatobacter sp.]|uniref:carboxypeptidase-like regulatory domain-containing protein n=1 Tax=Ilumatobacter sp. TaxID=1967498 RepID=UPI003AF836A1